VDSRGEIPANAVMVYLRSTAELGMPRLALSAPASAKHHRFRMLLASSAL